MSPVAFFRPLGVALGLLSLSGCEPDSELPDGTGAPPSLPNEATAEALANARTRFGAALLRSSGEWSRQTTGFAWDSSLFQVRSQGTTTSLRHKQSGSSVSFRLAEAAAGDVQPPALEDGVLLMDAGIAKAAQRFLVAQPAGVEDFVIAEAALQDGLRYTVELEGIAGLRQVSGVVEFLDAHGAPRVRIAAPFVVDADGRVSPATTTVHGCAVDRDVRAPWGRPLTSPGASSCEVVISYDTALPHPVLVDPDWQVTAVMATARTHHTSTSLDDGTVLVAGGFDASNSGLAVAPTELLCPETNICPGGVSFAVGASMPNARGQHAETFLPGVNKVLLTGGRDTRASNVASNVVSIFDVATGTFDSVPFSLSAGRFGHSSTFLIDGRVLVIGGEDGNSPSSAQVYNPVTNALSAPIPLANNKRRRFHVAEALGVPGVVGANPRVLVAGGLGTLGAEQSAEIFDPTTDSFTALSGPNSQLSAVRVGATATLLEDGRVLIVGGKNAAGLYSQTIDLFQPNGAAGTFVQTSVTMLNPRAFHGATKLLGEGKVLITGGVNASSVLSNAEVFDQTTGDFVDALSTTMKKARNFHTATRLISGKAIVIGGGVGGTPDSPGTGAVDVSAAIQAEFLARLNGDPCDQDGECLFNNCYSNNGPSICCNESCTDGCSSCYQADHADSNLAQGECGVRPNDAPFGTQCTEAVVLELVCQLGQISVDGIDSCNGYVCAADEITCRTNCQQDNQCSEDFFCNANACVEQKATGGTCDRDRQCESGDCVDGFCCSSSCDGICQACNLPGFEGTCSQAQGAPVGDRGPCPGENGCAGVCGSQADECDYDPEQVCSDATCSAGIQSSGLCGPNGVCEAGELECGDYDCDGNGERCRESCETSEECAGQAICRVDGTCAVVEEASCADEDTLTNPDGSTSECAPFRCANARCLDRCESIDDCVEGLVCQANNECAEPPGDPPAVEDCSLAPGGLRSNGSAWAWLAGLSAAAFLRKRGKSSAQGVVR